MATWDDVKGHIRSNYTLQKDEGDFFSMVFEFKDGRSQIVFVSREKTGAGAEWAQISSPVGVIKAGDMDKALEDLNDQICGGLVKIGEKHFVRHCMPIADLSAEEFDDPLSAVVGVADILENKYIGGDVN